MIITGKKFSKPAMSRVINGDVTLDAAPERLEKTRLDHWLMKNEPDFNRSSLQKFIKEGRVKVDGEVVLKPNYLIEEGAEVVLDLPADLQNPAERAAKVAAARPATIYEDANVLVLDKPAGLLSMAKGEYCPEPTLEDYGLLVHRLDRDTSGVVILAKNPETQTMLRRQFQERKAHKTYYAVVIGRPKLDEALIDLPIARNLKHPTTFQVEAGGKASETYYRVRGVVELSDEQAAAFGLAPGQVLSLVELKPKTGRTHQLRVHLKYIGTPILWDVVYGDLARRSARGDVGACEDVAHLAEHDDGRNEVLPQRLYLHAESLEISIPGEPNNQRRTFVAPLPGAFTALFGDFRDIDDSAREASEAAES